MSVFVSLLVIVACTLLATLGARILFRNIVPETVLLLVLGMVIGQYGWGWAEVGHEIELLRELGIAFLFLLAGFEVDTDDLRGKPGIAAGGAWIISLLLAFSIVGWVLPGSAVSSSNSAIAIAMTATALGTLLPILKDRHELKSEVGRTVMAHGTVGEIGPIMVMSVLLAGRATWDSVLILAGFYLLAIVLIFIPKRVQAAGAKIVDIIHVGADTTAQTTVRLTVVLLVGLIALADTLGLDIVLGAFAAGFIVRQAVPNGRLELEQKLDGLAYGFFIPVFFVISGMQVNFHVLTDNPWGWLVFLIALMAVRGVPVLLSTFIFPGPRESQCLHRNRVTIALYSTTSLPIIVAVTHVAVTSGVMGDDVASTLVLAGAASVLLMPPLAYLTKKAAESSLVQKSRKSKVSAARPLKPSEKKKPASAAMKAKKRPSTVKPSSITKPTPRASSARNAETAGETRTGTRTKAQQVKKGNRNVD